MKKFVFAVQVFGIIAMFPIYVLLEMNHGISKIPGNRDLPIVTGEQEKAFIGALNSESQVKILYPVKYMRVQHLRTTE